MKKVAGRLEAQTPEPLTKLELFAMAAMQGILANEYLTKHLEDQAKARGKKAQITVALASVKAAKATLAQLEEET